jgi:hypothetical protein
MAALARGRVTCAPTATTALQQPWTLWETHRGIVVPVRACARTRPLGMAALAEKVFQKMQIRRERDDERWPRSCDVWGTGVVQKSLGPSRVGVVQGRRWRGIATTQDLTVSLSLGLRLEASGRGSVSARQRSSRRVVRALTSRHDGGPGIHTVYDREA